MARFRSFWREEKDPDGPGGLLQLVGASLVQEYDFQAGPRVRTQP